MRLFLENHHHDFFTKNGYISFTDLFSEDLLDRADRAIFGNVRDLWRTQESIRSIVFQTTCAEIASTLTHSKIIRIAYDQSLYGHSPHAFPLSPFSLEDASSIQPLICGMILRLSRGAQIEQHLPFCPCPKERGEVLFISRKTLIIIEPLLSLPEQKFLLITYSNNRPQYVAKQKDPFVNFLKSMGYAFGDHLNHSTHPILFSQR